MPLDKTIKPSEGWTMPKPRLPGLPTFAALMLVAMLPVVVTFTGSVPATYKILKDFQTSIAALIALGAAGMAYKAAMAKVTLDREAVERAHVKERLGLFLRLKSQLQRMILVADDIVEQFDKGIQTREQKERPGRIHWDKEYMTLGDFDEIENAWKNIELLPRAAFTEIDSLRERLSSAKSFVSKQPDQGDVDRLSARYYRTLHKFISEQASSFLKIMEGALRGLD